ncbi:MAG: glycosyltransferase family 2 protein [Lachnospiraceae bacterium]|nr:glycosyltransferase family 2 protein [Lachnospiraceae bacterium]
MREVSIVIPNYNGKHFLEDCLKSVFAQNIENQEVIVVDNGSTDGSLEYLETFPGVRVIGLDKNYGFCRAVNEGIKAAKSEYVILLNNDTEVDKNFSSELLKAMKSDEKIFSCSSKMIQFHDRERMDDAGDYYCALGWAFGRGKGGLVKDYEESADVFAACAGAAIYRKKMLESLGYFDEDHFAYLEDIDIGYRARIHGFRNVYAPKAIVYHVGSGSSGSTHNAFKVKLSSRNNVYLAYKNMPFLQIILNSPFLLLGHAVKWLFFLKKGLGKEYVKGVKEGFTLCKREKKVRFLWKNLPNYVKIQLELWLNIVRRLK